MKFLSSLGLLISCGLSATAQGASLSTKWTIRNHTTEAISLSCENKSSKDLKISMKSASVDPGETSVYDWGDAYYNDGLWLNPGQWACQLTAGKKKAKQQDAESFASGWGESLTLVLQNQAGRIQLLKLPEGEPVAKGDSLQPKTTK